MNKPRESDETNRSFNQALSNFVFGVANRDLICHLADQGYSVRRIKEATDYPVSVEKIAETVWEHYVEKGVLRMERPEDVSAGNIKTEFVMDIGKYGRRSFRQVEVISAADDNREYAAVDIGIWKRHEPKKYQDYLNRLDSRKRDYIDGLPWPDARVYHELNLQFREILDMWQDPDR
ncbi:MAG: hypothetical protein J5819_03845 [Eubacterium sp.]|nr:hypothetical protein [Eubacterium sp.]